MKRISLLLALLVLSTGCGFGGEIVEVGDTVTVRYVGRFEDGAIFDTNIQDVAENPVLPKAESFTIKRVYPPLKFTTGTGEVIEGFDGAVIGMKEGDKKEIVIPPENAYGEWDIVLTETRPRITVVEIVEKVAKDIVTDYTGITKFEKNDTIPWRDWKARILVVDLLYVVLRNEVSNSTVNMDIGKIEIIVDDNRITETFTPFTGETIRTDRGLGRLRTLNDTHFMIDYNHLFAGKTLMFEITVESIEKAV